MRSSSCQHLLLLITGILGSVCWACSQSKSVVRDTYGFYTERQPGNIPVDPSGNPLPGFGVDTVFTIYVTRSGNNLKWDTAWAGRKVFTIVATEMPGPVIDAGLGKESNQPSLIKAGKGQVIWRLDLVPVDPLPELPEIYRKGVLIKGVKSGKLFEIRVGKLVELRIPPSV